jgi:hypothetical protein
MARIAIKKAGKSGKKNLLMMEILQALPEKLVTELDALLAPITTPKIPLSV